MEGGIKRALIDLNDRSRNLLQSLCDAVTVRRFERKNLENEHIERALRDGKSGRWHVYLNLLPFSIRENRSKVKASQGVYTAGIMFVLRSFAGGPLARKLSPLGLLLLSSIVSAAGLFALSTVHTPAQAFAAATIFGCGKAFFWPTMLGVTSERFPRGGALALAIMGGAGQLAAAFILPLMGGWYDAYGAATTFRYVGALPIALTAIFGALLIYYKTTGGYHSIQLKASSRS